MDKAIKTVVGDEFGMWVKNEERELNDLVGPAGPSEPHDDGLHEESDVLGEGVICGQFGLIWE